MLFSQIDIKIYILCPKPWLWPFSLLKYFDGYGHGYSF